MEQVVGAVETVVAVIISGLALAGLVMWHNSRKRKQAKKERDLL
jgi:hypothetical protein